MSLAFIRGGFLFIFFFEVLFVCLLPNGRGGRRGGVAIWFHCIFFLLAAPSSGCGHNPLERGVEGGGRWGGVRFLISQYVLKAGRVSARWRMLSN